MVDSGRFQAILKRVGGPCSRLARPDGQGPLLQ